MPAPGRLNSDSPEVQFSLPVLQLRLNRLGTDQSLSLGESEIERLFGKNDVAAARLRRFAKGHGCIVIHSDQGLTFRKMSNNKRH
jgi:hypothetical protein